MHSFASGPCALPQQVQDEMLTQCWSFGSTGIPLWSFPHRDPERRLEFLVRRSELTVRTLLGLSDDFGVAFLPGGATTQFTASLLNLRNAPRQIPRLIYLVRGHWSRKSWLVGKQLAGGLGCDLPLGLPEIDETTGREGVDFLYLTSNETADGTRIMALQRDSVPIVADMSSDIFTRMIDIDPYAVIFASAQKMFGIAGVTLVIFRKDLVTEPHLLLPSTLNYRLQAERHSLVNTPDVAALVAAGLMLEWIKDQGGVPAIEQAVTRRASHLYEAIDQSDLFTAIVPEADRSLTNILFQLPTQEIHDRFVLFAESREIVHLEGHREVVEKIGAHCRASMYAGTTDSTVKTLIDTMREFEGAA